MEFIIYLVPKPRLGAPFDLQELWNQDHQFCTGVEPSSFLRRNCHCSLCGSWCLLHHAARTLTKSAAVELQPQQGHTGKAPTDPDQSNADLMSRPDRYLYTQMYTLFSVNMYVPQSALAKGFLAD